MTHVCQELAFRLAGGLGGLLHSEHLSLGPLARGDILNQSRRLDCFPTGITDDFTINVDEARRAIIAGNHGVLNNAIACRVMQGIGKLSPTGWLKSVQEILEYEGFL